MICVIIWVYTGMGTDFEKKKSNLCCDIAGFTSSPPYLHQDSVQSHVIDMCPFKVLHWLPKKNPQMLKNLQNPHPCNSLIQPPVSLSSSPPTFGEQGSTVFEHACDCVCKNKGERGRQ